MAADGTLPQLLCKSARLQDKASNTWVPGTFTLYTTKLSWQPVSLASGVEAVHVGLISVTAFQRAKTKPLLRIQAGSIDKTFEFDSLLDRDSTADAYTQAKDALQQSSSRAASSAGARPGAGSKSGKTGAAVAYSGPLPDLAQKKEMLAVDPELTERYNRLVMSAEVLSEDEFWAGVMEEKAKAAAAAAAGMGSAGGKVVALPPPPGVGEQKTGLSNAMFHVPVDQEGRAPAVRFTLTPELVAQLFVEKPHVKRAFDANVPGSMSEKEFWTRYIRHEMAKEERRKRMVEAGPSTAAEAANPVPLEHGHLFSDLAGGDQPQVPLAEQRKVKKQLLASDPLVNVAADEADRYTEGFGILHNANKEPVVKRGLRAMAEDLARDINRHASVVLSGRKAIEEQGTKRKARDSSSPSGGGEQEEQLDKLAAMRVAEYGSSLEDLRADPAQQFQVIDLRSRPGAGDGDADMGLEGSAAHGYGDAMEVDGDAGGDVPMWLERLDPAQLSSRPMRGQRAYGVLLEVCGLSEEGGRGGRVVLAAQQAPEAVLAPAKLSQLRTQVKMVSDVSRHFWSCIPPNSADVRDKAGRLAQHINSVLWPEVDSTLKDANKIGGPQRMAIKTLLTPAQAMMEAVLDRAVKEGVWVQ